MSMFSAFDINASGLTAQRYRMDIISQNVANANTTRTSDGTPYRRKGVSFEEKGGQTAFSRVLGQAAYSHGYTGQGVKVRGVYEDYSTEMNMVYDPSHPDADENGYVTASLAATPGCEGAPVIGLVAHMDTSDEASDEHIKPRIVEYLGGDITLNADCGIVMRAGDYPSLAGYVGSQLIVTDGTTLLGADDKAGIAEIVTAAERLISSGAPHGGVRICFTPDEEIGAGADHFDVAAFGADYAYTVDGGALGEMEYECFNAASGRVDFHGIAIHLGSAKGHM